MSHSTATNWRRLSRSNLGQSVLAFAVKLGAGLASYLLFALAARALGPHEFGVFGVAFSAAMLLGIAGSFGQQIFLLKEVPNARVAGVGAREPTLYRFAFLLTAGGATFSAVGLIAVYRYGLGLDQTKLAVGGGLLCIAFAVSQTTMGALRVQDCTMFAIVSRDLCWRLLSMAGLAGASLWAMGRPDALDAATVLCILAMALLPVIFMHAHYVHRHLRDLPPGESLSPHWRAWLAISSGLALIGVISSADLYLYTMVLGILLPSAQAGAFFAALKTVELLNLFLMAVTLVIAPELSTLVSKGDNRELQRKCNSAIILQGTPVLLACIVVLLAAPLLMWLFEPSYLAYTSTLRLLVVGMLVNALTGATVLLLQLAGLHWRQVAYQGGSLLFAIALLPLLTAYFGILGAAISFIIAKTLWNVLAIVAIRRKLGVDPSVLGLLDRRSGGIGVALRDIGSQWRLAR